MAPGAGERWVTGGARARFPVAVPRGLPAGRRWQAAREAERLLAAGAVEVSLWDADSLFPLGDGTRPRALPLCQ